MVLNQNSNNYMDFQRLSKLVDDYSSSRQVIPNHFDLNLMPQSAENDDDEVFISQPHHHIQISQPSHHHNLTPQEGSINSNVLPIVLNSADENPTPFNSQINITQEVHTTHFNPYIDNDRERVPSSGSSSVGDVGRAVRRRRRLPANYNDVSRRICTNFNCRTKNTPMWRKGPLGPKTLCNACGIQYKKQVTRRGSNL